MMGIPFKEKFWRLIKEGKKTTTIRTLKYDYNGICLVKGTDIKIEILSKRLISIPDDIDDEVVKSEGFKDKNELLRFFHRYKLPQTMKIYNFKVINTV